MSITPLKFTGISTFSEDFQTILARAVSIASVPIQQLQNSQTDMLSKKQSLAALRTAVADLAVSLEWLGEVGEQRSLSVTSTNVNRVTVSKSGAATSGTYHIQQIASIAASAAESLQTGLDTSESTAVDGDGELELVVGTSTVSISLTSESNNLNGLRDVINAAGAGVTATVINSGAASGAYYLSLTAKQTGETSLVLRTEAGNDATNLLTSSNQGSNAEFYLNGIQIIRRDNVISDVIDGLILTIVDTTEEGEEVTIAANSSRASLANGLTNFASAYNALAAAVNNHIGENAGILSGDPILRQIQGMMRTVTSYKGDGTIQSLAALGISLDKTGSMSFDSTRFYSLSTAEFESSLDLMGTTTTGFGALAAKLDEISNPITGLIKKQQDTLDSADARMDNQIAALQERIEVMQASLSLKLQQADLLISQFSSQQQQLDVVIKSLNALSFGKEKGS
ncbi:MAG: flagellar filament capping protein FliD [Bryobacteraceae bacterium]|nr:flagellar filament capping protein FliD [Bryobacteraceae bacterium]